MQVTYVQLFSRGEEKKYTRITMGAANLPDIFQHKMNDLFHGFEFISAYIYDLLFLTKGYWTYHVQKL